MSPTRKAKKATINKPEPDPKISHKVTTSTNSPKILSPKKNPEEAESVFEDVKDATVKSALVESNNRLEFKQSLINGNKKPLSRGETSPKILIAKLEDLHAKLKALVQEGFQTDSLDLVAQELINTQLTTHKNERVRALTGCCLADVLRLYAPDAPYETKDLRAIFKLFLSLLEKISFEPLPQESYSYSYILKSLSTIKSAILITELDDNEVMLTNYFKVGFKLAEKKLDREHTSNLTDVLEVLIQEASSIPTEVIELILSQFNNERQLEFPGAFSLSKALCSAATGLLQGPISQYFSDILASPNENKEDEASSLQTKPAININQAHALIQSIHYAEPGILLSVIPQLEAELGSIHTKRRELAVTTVGSMLAKSTSDTLISTYPDLLKKWLQRRSDKSLQIRVAWVHQCSDFYRENSPMVKEIHNGLKERLIDIEEKVRTAACQSLSKLSYRTFTYLVPKYIISELGRCIRDKKAGVRSEAIQLLAVLYDQAYSDLILADSSEHQLISDKFSWIPSSFLELVLVNDAALTFEVEKAFRTHLLGSSNDLEERTNRLLYVLNGLSDKARNAFKVFLNYNARLCNDMRDFITICRKLGGEVKKYSESDELLQSQLKTITNVIALKLPEHTKASESLLRYPQANDKQLNKLIFKLIDPSTTFHSSMRTTTDVLNRVNLMVPTSSDVFQSILMRLAPTLIHKDMLTILIDQASSLSKSTGPRSEDYKDSEINLYLGYAAQRLLKDLPISYPLIFGSHVREIIRLLLLNDSFSDVWLSALACYARTNPKCTFNELLVPRLSEYILEGTPQQAQDAAAVLSCFDPTGHHIETIIENIVQDLSPTHPHLPARLLGLGELVATHPTYTEPHMGVTLNFIIKELFPLPVTSPEGITAHFVPQKDLPELLLAKVNAMSLLVNRSVAYFKDPVKQRLVIPVLAFLWSILENKGEMSADGSTPDSLKAHLRLEAGRSILKLACCPIYERQITPGRFYLLSELIQDPVFNVREAFGSTLMKFLGEKKLHTRFFSILFLAAFEVETHFKTQVKSFIKFQANRDRALSTPADQRIEMVFPQFVHLLAHDSDFSIDANGLKHSTKYIEFFLATVAGFDNISLLFSLACQIKLTEDASTNSKTQNLYILSDLTQHIITSKKVSNFWHVEPVSLDSLSPFPQDLFTPLTHLAPEAISEMSKKNYLPDWFFEESVHFMVPPDQFQNKVRKHSKDAPPENQLSRKMRAESEKIAVEKPKSKSKVSRKRHSTAPLASPRKNAPRLARPKPNHDDSDEEEGSSSFSDSDC